MSTKRFTGYIPYLIYENRTLPRGTTSSWSPGFEDLIVTWTVDVPPQLNDITLGELISRQGYNLDYSWNIQISGSQFQEAFRSDMRTEVTFTDQDGTSTQTYYPTVSTSAGITSGKYSVNETYSDVSLLQQIDIDIEGGYVVNYNFLLILNMDLVIDCSLSANREVCTTTPQPGPSPGPSPTPSDGGNNLTLIIIGAVVVVILLLVFFFALIHARRKRQATLST